MPQVNKRRGLSKVMYYLLLDYHPNGAKQEVKRIGKWYSVFCMYLTKKKTKLTIYILLNIIVLLGGCLLSL